MNRIVVMLIAGAMLVPFMLYIVNADNPGRPPATTLPDESETQAAHKIPVGFTTSPSGADVILNGEFVGKTSVGMPLAPGSYEVQFVMDGFETAEETFTVEPNSPFNVLVSLTLKPVSDDLFRFYSWTVNLEWDTEQNLAYFVNQNRYSILNLQNGEVTPTERSVSFSWLEADEVQALLGATTMQTYNMTGGAFISPSGRYLAYQPDQETAIQFYDTRLETVIDSDAQITYTPNLVNKVHRLEWSPGETTVRIYHRATEADCLYVLFKENGVETRCLAGFKVADSDQLAYVEERLSYPTDAGLMLVLANTAMGVPFTLWLVDLHSMTGQEVPVDDVLDAAFSTDGETIYIIHQGGISTVMVDNLAGVELLTDRFEGWHLRQAFFSPHAEYVIIEEGSPVSDASTSWVYKLSER